MLPGRVVSCPSLSFIWGINLPFHSLWTSQTNSQPLALAQTNPVHLDFISDWKVLFNCQFDLYLASNLFLELSYAIFVVFSVSIFSILYITYLWICIWTDFPEPFVHLHFFLSFIQKEDRQRRNTLSVCMFLCLHMCICIDSEQVSTFYWKADMGHPPCIRMNSCLTKVFSLL